MSKTTSSPAYTGGLTSTDRTKWIAKGKIYKSLGTPPKDSAIDSDIEIPETGGIEMPDGRNIFGEPVNARLAIFYIRKLWKEIERKRLLQIHRDTKEFFAKLIRDMDEKSKGFDKDEFLEGLKIMDAKWEEANEWLIELLRNSFGITMDKSVLLKTLSQPECEGVRFYLAMKKKSEDRTHKPGEIYDEEGFPVKLTLVTVGVDRAGTDLHYKYEKLKHTRDVIPDIENRSLCTEYPRTPDIPEKYKVDSPALVPYVLFRYAMVKDEE